LEAEFPFDAEAFGVTGFGAAFTGAGDLLAENFVLATLLTSPDAAAAFALAVFLTSSN
jgi:hypothetical protein